MISLRRYTANDAPLWDAFVEGSKNGTFLLKRAYMDYHADRFHDHSLLFFDSKAHLIALLPACQDGETLYSHRGLTYGGLITTEAIQVEQVIEVFNVLNTYLAGQGIKKVVYKPVPQIFHSYPSDEDLYALFYVCDAKLIGRNVASVVPFAKALKWSENRRRNANKAMKSGITVSRSTDFAKFWEILEDNLERTYKSKPVHTLNEIEKLAKVFPENINLYMAFSQTGEPLAGVLLYITQGVAHTQYISASEQGKAQHALDALFYTLMHQEDIKAGKTYFDFGTSNGDNGHYLNTSLIHQKQGFGGRAVCYDIYEWEVK